MKKLIILFVCFILMFGMFAFTGCEIPYKPCDKPPDELAAV